jgi:hypothetical protein
MASLVELPPATFVKLIRDSPPSATSMILTSPTLVGVAKSGVHLTTDDGTSVSIGNIDGESLKTFGLLALSLLATNLVVCLVLLVFAVLNCLRRRSNKNKGRTFIVGETAATQYVPVRVEDDVYSGDHKRYGE